MDQAKLDLITASIKQTVDKLAAIGEGFVPEFTPEIIIGRAVIDAVPELADIVNSWVSGTPGTPEERAAVAKEIHDLVVDPENI